MPACPRLFIGTRCLIASQRIYRATMPERFAEIGDPHADMDAAPGSLEPLLELAAR